jgi:hypothetical protein
LKAQHGWLRKVGFKEQLICSHKYKTTASMDSLNAVRKFF